MKKEEREKKKKKKKARAEGRGGGGGKCNVAGLLKLFADSTIIPSYLSDT